VLGALDVVLECFTSELGERDAAATRERVGLLTELG
jgi:hypothetical protein